MRSRAWTWMGAFGGRSPKGTTLWSSRFAVHKLNRSLPDKVWSHEMTKKTILSNGKLSISGGRDLKSSQAYTPEFGFSTLSVWLSEPDVVIPDMTHVKIPNIWASIPQKRKVGWCTPCRGHAISNFGLMCRKTFHAIWCQYHRLSLCELAYICHMQLCSMWIFTFIWI